MKILITDSVDPQCCEILKAEGFDVDYRPGLPQEEIKKAIKDASVLIVRSQTQVGAEVLNVASLLKIVGRAGAGVDNIDVDAATRRGVIVMNTPGGNTVSTAEHTMAMILALSRNIPQAGESLKAGKWERKKFIGTELFEKTLGIVGLGKVGAEVAKRATAFHMSVIAYDPVLSVDAAAKIGVELIGLDDLYGRSDFISIHSPLTAETKDLLNEDTLRKCKKGVRIINCARGGIVNERALLAALNSDQVAGASLDVFEEEPPTDMALIRHPNVVSTPHLGASTEEAQEKVAIQIAHQVADALKGKGVIGSVNAGMIQVAMRKDVQPFLVLAEKMGALLGQLKLGKIHAVVVSVCGPILVESLEGISAAALKGLFEKILSEPVNYVNSPVIARERGIGVELRQHSADEDYAHVLTVMARGENAEKRLSGTVFGTGDVRIVSIDGFRLDLVPRGNLLFYSNIDRPGMLARVSGILSSAGINIARLSLGRLGTSSEAMTVVSTDTTVPGAVVGEIATIEGVSDVRNVLL